MTMKFKQGHGVGFADALRKRCWKIAEDRRKQVSDTNNTCTALVVVRKEVVDKYIEDFGCETVKQKQSVGDYLGRTMGRSAGASIALGGAIDNKSNKLLK